jgi:FtsZ-binding cell division protein ZapB
MTDFVSEFLKALMESDDAPKVKVVGGKDGLKGLIDVLSSAVASAVASADCGDDDCPIHGSQAPEAEARGLIGDDEVNALDSRMALDLAVAAGAAAENAIRRGDLRAGRERRELATMWIDLHTALADQEEANDTSPLAKDLARQAVEIGDLQREVEILKSRNRSLLESNQRLAESNFNLQEKVDALQGQNAAQADVPPPAE